MLPPVSSPLLFHRGPQSIVSNSLSLSRSRSRSCFYSSSTPSLSARRPPPSAPRPGPPAQPLPWQPRQNPNNHSSSSHSSPPPHAPSAGTELSLKTKSIILAVAIAIIAASGAIIGASLRQEIQRSSKQQGSNLFSKVGSVQVVGTEALTYGDAHVAAATAAVDGSGEGVERRKPEEEDIQRTPSTATAVATTEEDSNITAQIKLLETKRASLIQQRLVTEKKMEGLGQRIRERSSRDQTNENG